MANPHPEPHPENLRPFKKGDKSTQGTQRNGAKASNKKQAERRSMREWALLMGQLPVHKGKVKDPKNLEEIALAMKGGDPKKYNLTMDGAIIAAMYTKAMKGDVRAAEYLAKLKDQIGEDVTVHIDTMAKMDTAELLKLYEATKEKE